MNDAKGCFVILIVVVLIGAFGAAAFDTIRPHTIDPSQDSINMVQPYGWMPERDAHYAQEVNDPNSHANLNNGQANLYNAQATAVIIEQYKNEVDAQSKGDTVVGFLQGASYMFFALFVLGIVFLFIFGKH